MITRRSAQTNIRSDIVKRRIREVTTRTGMTARQFIEEAVMRFDPPAEILPPGVTRRGWLLVTSPPPGVTISLDDINAAIAAERSDDRY